MINYLKDINTKDYIYNPEDKLYGWKWVRNKFNIYTIIDKGNIWLKVSDVKDTYKVFLIPSYCCKNEDNKWLRVYIGFGCGFSVHLGNIIAVDDELNFVVIMPSHDCLVPLMIDLGMECSYDEIRLYNNEEDQF